MYQKIMIVGNLGRDPKLRYTPTGSPVCNFDVATNRKGKDDEQVTCWFRVACWGSLAETCNEHLAKGRQVLVEGELRSDPETGGPRTWTRQDGTPGASFEVNARLVKFLGGGGRPGEPEPKGPFTQEELPF